MGHFCWRRGTCKPEDESAGVTARSSWQVYQEPHDERILCFSWIFTPGGATALPRRYGRAYFTVPERSASHYGPGCAQVSGLQRPHVREGPALPFAHTRLAHTDRTTRARGEKGHPTITETAPALPPEAPARQLRCSFGGSHSAHGARTKDREICSELRPRHELTS